MGLSKRILLNLPLIAVAAAWAPLAQLVMLAENSAECDPAPTYSIVLSTAVKAPRQPQPVTAAAQPKSDQTRQVKLLKPVTEHLDTASTLHFGPATVAKPVARFTWTAAELPAVVAAPDFQAIDSSPPDSARAPPAF